MFTVRFEIPITVLDESQAQRLLEAVNSGYAEQVLKNAVLYNIESGGGTGRDAERGRVPKKDLEPLTLIQGKSHKAAPAEQVVPQEDVSQRSRGVIGRRGFTRKGG